MDTERAGENLTGPLMLNDYFVRLLKFLMLLWWNVPAAV